MKDMKRFTTRHARKSRMGRPGRCLNIMVFGDEAVAQLSGELEYEESEDVASTFQAPLLNKEDYIWTSIFILQLCKQQPKLSI